MRHPPLRREQLSVFFAHVPSLVAPLGGRSAGISGVQRHSLVVCFFGRGVKKREGVQRDCSLLIIYLVTVCGVDGLNQHT